MPPMPGKPLLPDELYPVDYEDLSTLTGLSPHYLVMYVC